MLFVFKLDWISICLNYLSKALTFHEKLISKFFQERADFIDSARIDFSGSQGISCGNRDGLSDYLRSPADVGCFFSRVLCRIFAWVKVYKPFRFQLTPWRLFPRSMVRDKIGSIYTQDSCQIYCSINFCMCICFLPLSNDFCFVLCKYLNSLS